MQVAALSRIFWRRGNSHLRPWHPSNVIIPFWKAGIPAILVALKASLHGDWGSKYIYGSVHFYTNAHLPALYGHSIYGFRSSGEP